MAKKKKSTAKRAIIAAVGKLSIKHKLFVKEYVKDKNATRAYIAVYGKSGTKAAAQCASRLLTNAKVAEAVEQQLVVIADKLDISAERTLKRIADIAYHDKWAKNSDVLKGCELLGRHFKMFVDKVETEHSGAIGVVDQAEVKKTMDDVEKEV